jgi:acetoin utilization deacetylase AcuC-like enzyme
MAVTRSVGVVEDPRYREHRGPGTHPERPERLAAVGRAIAERAAALRRLPSRPASDEELLRVHAWALLRQIEAAAQRAPEHLDPDTYVSAQSFAVARLAAGAAVDLARAVARDELQAGFAAVRPPGHHAERDQAMGFCLFNNVAVASEALRREEGIERLLILDWDVHHGNGTQRIFQEDRDVLYFSTHQFPCYPGSGAVSEAGQGPGTGSTVNVPLLPGSGDAELVGALRRILVPVAERFRPQLILVSAGFDAHRDDPLASLEVTREGFAEASRIVRALADDLCGGRVAVLLEGGYSPSGLYEGVSALLDALLAEETPSLAPCPAPPAGSGLAQVIERLRSVHGSRYPDLGSA